MQRINIIEAETANNRFDESPIQNSINRTQHNEEFKELLSCRLDDSPKKVKFTEKDEH